MQPFRNGRKLLRILTRFLSLGVRALISLGLATFMMASTAPTSIGINIGTVPPLVPFVDDAQAAVDSIWIHPPIPETEIDVIRVKATREGLLGHKTYSGYVIDPYVSFVALPAIRAVFRHVRIVNPANGKETIAQVLDVGPFNEEDDNYVFNGARPLSESGISVSGKGTNHAGIDLSERVWHILGMTDNTEVEWEFI